MKTYLLLADGFETIEALTPVDVLRRAGVDIKTVSISASHNVTSSQKIEVKADLIIDEKDLSEGDMLILPGGYPGYVNLGESKIVGQLASQYFESGKFLAAICGAPTVLAKNGIAMGSKITCHSSVVNEMDGYNYVGGNVVIDGKLITGIGAGHSVEFALTLAEILTDSATVKKVKKGMEL